MKEKCRLVVGKATSNWYVEYYELGKRFRVYCGAPYGLPKSGNKIKSVVERKKYFKELYDLVLNSTSTIKQKAPTSFNLEDAFKIALDAKGKKLMDRSIRKLRINAARLIKDIGNISLKNITSKTIITYLDSLTIAPQSVNSIRTDLHALFAYLVEIEVIPENPVTKSKNRKIISREKNAAYSDDELKLVFSACQDYAPNLYLIACLMYVTFLRPSEIIRLKREDIDFENMTIAPKRHTRKTNDTFTVKMTLQLKNDLILYEKHLLKSSDFLLTNQHGKPLSDYYYSMSFLRLKNSVLKDWISKNQTFNSLRHTAAIKIWNKTQNLKHLSMLMGHTSIQTTIIYLRSLGKIVGDISENDLLEY
jgi:integrase